MSDTDSAEVYKVHPLSPARLQPERIGSSAHKYLASDDDPASKAGEGPLQAHVCECDEIEDASDCFQANEKEGGRTWSLCFGTAAVTGILNNLVLAAFGFSVEALDLVWSRQGALWFLFGFGALGFIVTLTSERGAARLQKHQGSRGSKCCRGCAGVGMSFAFFFGWVGAVRRLSLADLDDLHPELPCDFLEDFVESSSPRYLWIIPLAMNTSIASDPEWCARMLALERRGFVLGMHGVLHEMHPDGSREFECCLDAEKELARGVAAWREAFGKNPTTFAFPGNLGTARVVELVRSRYNMTVRLPSYTLMHRIYHCDTSWCWVWCKNWFVNIW
eukprot:TRINITY_DN20934_c0_g1_i1.p1 TRINITY_DN20934_c0_g1~~TRINITY_DN20934_c0_g1_i1.p1  ORF type:complete len:333 (-),score=23.06 TRINITY_DN20934_c0_g1_i1:586-1584(-)